MKHILMLATVVLVLAGCDDPGSPPPTTLPVGGDTCFNDSPYSPNDSAQYPEPWVAVTINVWDVTRSATTGLLMGNIHVIHGGHIAGVFVYDPEKDALLAFVQGTAGGWSPDGNRALIEAWDGHYIYDACTGSLRRVSLCTEMVDSHWSLDGSRIEYSYRSALWSIDTTGADKRCIEQGLWYLRPSAPGRYLGFDTKKGMYYYDTTTRTQEYVQLRNLPAGRLTFVADHGWDLSPNRKRVLIDIQSRSYDPVVARNEGGLWLIDMETNVATKILPPQYWPTTYQPRWLSNTTFSGSFFCMTRNLARSTEMVWEWDLVNNTVKPITQPWMRLFPW